MINMTSL